MYGHKRIEESVLRKMNKTRLKAVVKREHRHMAALDPRCNCGCGERLRDIYPEHYTEAHEKELASFKIYLTMVCSIYEEKYGEEE